MVKGGVFVGRDEELQALDDALALVSSGAAKAVAVAGEPGIGKTRLLAELRDRAELRRMLVLSGAASELERQLPFSVFVHALDEYMQSLDGDVLAALDDDVQAELAHVLPSLARLAVGRVVAPQHERYRSHRAVRALLERLAAPGPLLVVLDDVHWADSASAELLDALLRKPPAAGVLLAIALRPRQTRGRFAAALERAHRDGELVRIELRPLTTEETRGFLGDRPDAGVLYHEAGGNPFYLEQLARSGDGLRSAGAKELSLGELDVPPAVSASLSEELTFLSVAGRIVLEGAAVAGDPFELDVAATAAAVADDVALAAIDELAELELVRMTDVPRRFRFRHPLVRRAVYDATAAGWRLGAHERCAQELAARGASAAVRAHHIERSARQGDVAAVAVLRRAGEEAARLAPDSAARWFGSALRLLPGDAAAQDRVELLLARAWALAAAGHFADSHGALLEGISIGAQLPPRFRITVATACAGVERFLGRYEQAHERLVGALDGLDDAPSVESAELLIELTLNEFYRSRYGAMQDWGARAVEHASVVDDAPLLAFALAMRALGDATAGPTEQAHTSEAQAAACVDQLSDEELSQRTDAAAWLAAAEIYLDLYVRADAHATRALRLVRAGGQGDPLFRLYPILPRVWYVRGKLAEAAELLDEAIEGGRLLGSPPALAGNFFNRSVVALAAGDLDTALATAEEGVALTRSLDEGFVSAWAALRLAAVLLETHAPDRAVELLLHSAGGSELTLIPGSWRAYGLELLTRCWLAQHNELEAEAAAGRAELAAARAPRPLATAWADRAAAAVALYRGSAFPASERALASANAAQLAGAPIEEGLARTLAGRALAAAGDTERAVEELVRAATTFDHCGAIRYRESAERELGKLGRRPYRRSRSGVRDGAGVESLTERELQVARLVVDRRTNSEIAGQLFLSQKTVETHLRNIFRKVGVASRVELARAVEIRVRDQGRTPMS
jgi:DNA-binding CsgD family transcriptional regulator/tetratricopeptide (TPR) repeat protein